ERRAEKTARFAVHLGDGPAEILERLLEVGLLLAVEGEALLLLLVLAGGVEVDWPHAIDEVRKLRDPLGVLLVRGRQTVVVAHHPLEVEAAELFTDRADQVLAAHGEALQRELVRGESFRCLAERGAQALQQRLAFAETGARLVEHAASFGQRRL